MNVFRFLIKLASGFVAALVLVFGINYTASFLFSTSAPAQPGYEIAVQEGGATAAEAPREIPIEELFAQASIERGEKVAKKCAACHNFKEGAGSKVGPELYGVVGRQTATFPGFKYSDAMKAHGGSWDALMLNTYLTNPKAEVPGTSMAFAGLPKAAERADLIAYLNSLSANPKPLPTAAAAAPAQAAPAAEAPAAPAEAPAAPAAEAPAAEPAPAAPAQAN